MNRVITFFILLTCASCTTTGNVRNWEQVTITMPKNRVHALLGKPTVSLTREQWDEETLQAHDNIQTYRGIVLSSSMLCQFETVESWEHPKCQEDKVKVYFGKTGKVLGKLPYQVR